MKTATTTYEPPLVEVYWTTVENGFAVSSSGDISGWDGQGSIEDEVGM